MFDFLDSAAPVDSPVAPTIESLVYTPLETPSPEQRLKVCITKCLLYLENTYPACHGRFTPEEYSPETFCHTFGYVCKHACSYEW
ncbi:hypothetical protein CPC16_010296 [Podila verticillata]|nr:hypothetical protein CPC16_010296 [Podila verticillata]